MSILWLKPLPTLRAGPTLFFILCLNAISFWAAPQLVGAVDRPQRIVSMTPSATEILFAIGAGDRVVGVSDYCDYPESVQGVPSVGNLVTPNVEAILRLRPDLVLAIESYGRKHLDRMRALGLNVKSFYGDPGYEATFQSILDIGRWAGHEAEAQQVVADMRRGLDEIAWPKGRAHPRALWVVWWDPLMTTGGKTFIHETLEKAGGRNISREVQQESFTLSLETVIAADPEVIVLPCAAGEECERIAEKFHNRFGGRAGWSGVGAVRRKAYCPIDQNLAHRPGPRVVEAVRKMNQCFIRLGGIIR